MTRELCSNWRSISDVEQLWIEELIEVFLEIKRERH
jgi:hypothetical protein